MYIVLICDFTYIRYIAANFRKMNRSLLFFVFTFVCMNAGAQTIISLYNGKIPNSIESKDSPGYKEEKMTDSAGQIKYNKVTDPTLEVYFPKEGFENGTAVLIIPGGGYGTIAYTHEGIKVASEFNKMGVTAFVLKYRLPSDIIMADKTIGPLQDAQQGLKIIRSRAAEWKIDPQKVGIIGFSAGGHLASTAGTHFRKAVIENTEGINLRPDFMVLVYPVISLSDSLMHKGSRTNLLGLTPSEKLIVEYSNELHITRDTPPTLLIHSGDDKSVKVGNSIKFYENLIAKGVSAEMHLYPTGGHGFGLIPERSPDQWTERIQHWLKAIGIIKF